MIECQRMKLTVSKSPDEYRKSEKRRTSERIRSLRSDHDFTNYRRAALEGFWQSIIGADEGLPVEDASLTGFSQFSKLLKIKECWIRSVTGQRSNQLRYTPQNTRIVALLSS